MKKIVSILAAMLIVCNLVACDPLNYNYNLEWLKENVVTVELIKYDNPNAKTLFENRAGVIPFQFEKMEVIETLEVGRYDDFLQDFSQIRFLEYWKHSDSPNGTSVRMVYQNGDFEVVSFEVCYAGSFTADGNVKKFIGGLSGRRDLVRIINDFFEHGVTE